MKTHDLYSYRVIWSEEDQEYVGLCAELPSFSFLEKNQEKAFAGIRDLVRDTLIDMQENHERIPEPISTQRFSGKFMVRIPPDIHRKLALEASEAQISLNRYVSAKLASNAGL